MSDEFSVRLQKEQLVFSAAHFITFTAADGREVCESLHGHNYGVVCDFSGPLQSQSYVVDFIWLRDQLQQIVAELDHRVLLPLRHPRIKVEAGRGQVEVQYAERRWSFPREDCVLLSTDNTTAERLAEHIGRALLARIGDQGMDSPRELAIGVDENHGQWGYWSFRDASKRAE